jgi:hypothetical protein
MSLKYLNSLAKKDLKITDLREEVRLIIEAL